MSPLYIRWRGLPKRAKRVCGVCNAHGSKGQAFRVTRGGTFLRHRPYGETKGWCIASGWTPDASVTWAVANGYPKCSIFPERGE